mgnify:CR=1 FL=1
MMIKLGAFEFHLYGLMVGLGVWLGAWTAEKIRNKFKNNYKFLSKIDIWDNLVWIVGMGIIGARIYHVIDFWGYYKNHLVEVPQVWLGGLGIYGGIIGGIIGARLATKEKQRFLGLLDLGGVGLPLGQAIGRWGNWFNQELYGKPTDLPWGIYIEPEKRLLSVIEKEYFHPLFFYESLWCLVSFLLIIKTINCWKIGQGRVISLYLGLYGFGRLVLEFWRIDSWTVNGVNVAQAISTGLIVISATYLWYSRK